MKAKKIPSDRRRLEREAEKLIREGRMPSLDEVLQAVLETRCKFVPLIRAARAESKRSKHDCKRSKKTKSV